LPDKLKKEGRGKCDGLFKDGETRQGKQENDADLKLKKIGAGYETRVRNIELILNKHAQSLSTSMVCFLFHFF
jgi:hypothetical protein